MSYCTSCGNKVEQGSKHCAACGAPLKSKLDTPSDIIVASKSGRHKSIFIIAVIIVILLAVAGIITSSTSKVEDAYGNTGGNIVNGGVFAFQDDWIYVSGDKKLHKMRVDGSNVTMLWDEYVGYINVVDDWVYFGLPIHKIRIDGTGLTKLTDDFGFFINVVGDWIYYSNGSDDEKLYKIRTDGTERTKLGDDRSESINVVGNWIYYVNRSDGRKPYKIQVNGTERTKLCDDAALSINVLDGWVYYSNSSDEYKLYKILTDGTERTKLCDDAALSINVLDGWVYYSNSSDEYKLYKIRTDGTERTKLCDEESVLSTINIVSDWVYYVSEDHGWCKISTGGTDHQILSYDYASDIAVSSEPAVPANDVYILYSVESMEDNKVVDHDLLSQVVEVLRKRLVDLGVNSPNIFIENIENKDSIKVGIPDTDILEEVEYLIGKVALLSIVVPDGTEIVGSAHIQNAYADRDKFYGPIVRLELNPEGTERLSDATSKYLGQKLSIFFDNEVISMPIIEKTIDDGMIEISGLQSFAEASILASLIRNGPLPVYLYERGVVH